MALGDVEEMFISGTCRGMFFPFFTVREIAKKVKDDPGNVNRYIKILLKCGVLREYPLNESVRAKRYQVDKDYYYEVYGARYIPVLETADTRGESRSNGVKSN